MLIPVNLSNGLSLSEDEVEDVTFSDLGLTESQVEEFLRKNIEFVFEESETLLIVGQQVINAAGGRSDLIALDENGSVVLIEIKRDAWQNSLRTAQGEDGRGRETPARRSH